MIFVDDRPPEQKGWLIVMMTDRVLSGWGQAEGGPSYAGWAVPNNEISEMKISIRNRKEAKNVRIVLGTYKPPTGPGHCHIYAWKERKN